MNLLPFTLPNKKMKMHEVLRILRSQRGYTQEYMADRLGIDTVNYGRIERGQAKLTIDRLEQIADILGIEVADVFAHTLRPGRTKDSDDAGTHIEVRALLDYNIALSKQIIQEIKELKREGCAKDRKQNA